MPVAQRPEVLLLLLVGRPVQQGVHVALVGRLAVEHERAVAGLGRLGLHHGELDVAEAHAAPLLGHVRQPQPLVLRLLAQVDQRVDVGGAIARLEALASMRPLRPHHVGR